ncbi:CheR family methyltransferase [Gaiella sp.]|uniref:CheR family methyltransferase n=1 Tax=Gaiella sp. TaxID=2663207 RepID=UPI002E34BC37|nr:CheR family methyltransferase [Gaiella sp.]HEX5583217.1 CheR family methyltransferase [Gaiella sp.]
MTNEDNQDRDFDELLLMLKESRGFDFTGYKRSTLERRVNRRMTVVGLSTFAEYRDYLELEPEEFSQLFDSMLINVTSFFRDPLAWQALRERVIPELLSAKGAKAPVRVWSAGCATGEEAYTLAIILAEAMGADQFRERVKIYATDLDEDALQQARTGTYETSTLAGVPEELVNTYFEVAGTKRAFRRDLRRQVIFGRNNLTHDAPISRVDLLAARNMLMYFNAETQASIVRRFHFALSYPGYLFLGKAEMLLNHSDRFQPVDLRKRLFRKAPPTTMMEPGRPVGWTEASGREQSGDRLECAALASGPAVQLAIDLADKLRLANSAAEALFNLRPRDLGRPFQDLEVSYRPAELRSRIDQVRKELRPIELHDVEWLRSGSSEPGYYDISVVPLFGAPGDLIGVGVSFVDVTRYRRVRDELSYANTELERAYEELQSLNEELETTNEELETMNEELQSTNEEMEATNDELVERSTELGESNFYFQSALASMRTAVVVVNADLRVQTWNLPAEDLWGLRSDEVVGQHFLDLDIGLPVDRLRPLIRSCLAGEADGDELTLDATNRRGKTISCRVICTPLRASAAEIRGAILLMEAI